ncbi:hypothetical protein ACVWZR_007750 [Bradyrhizobium sp. i1.3.1]
MLIMLLPGVLLFPMRNEWVYRGVVIVLGMLPVAAAAIGLFFL